ncbi:MAG: Crp/Fnr family transcriptional regulator [Firmicutes bacterium]|nr:Crp/Fnr family transcriptional regulator [Bacillota bacterium]MDD4693307.1 Crp/Fnr family transcriptional regulator [Bacillota bacterium]
MAGKKSINCQESGCLKCHGGFCGQRVPIFSGLKESDYAKVAGLIVHKDYDKGEMIFREGDLFPYLAIVRTGLIKTFKYTIEGREQILGMFGEGDFVGEINLLSGKPCSANCAAINKTGLCLIPRDSFQALLKQHSDIMFLILEELATRVGRLESLVQQLGTQNADSRLIALLIQLGERYGKDQGENLLVELPLSREGLANYIGVTRETVSRKLNQLKEDGLIELIGNRKVLIKNLVILRERA